MSQVPPDIIDTAAFSNVRNIREDETEKLLRKIEH
jgi:hypothetical protein